MNYEEIYKPLSRTSFESKMERAFYSSIETMSINGQVENGVLRKILLPDEIETFVLNSIVVSEYKRNIMTDKQFNDVMNAIRNYHPPVCYEKLNTDHLKWVLPTMGAVQFESQQYSFFRLYRHHYLFSYINNNVNVNELFIKKFGKSFDEYAAVVLTFQLLLAKKMLVEWKQYWQKIAIKEPWFIQNLKITRNEYIQELSQFAKSNSDYRYCLRPSYSYPFIEYNGDIYLPTPHLLIQSITTAMMNRMTYENNRLREMIGKNACEEYLFKIVYDSGLFDEVKPEYEYKKGLKTLDVLTRKGNTALLIDSKLFSPKVSLRIFDEEAYRKDAARMVKEIKQAYIHAHDKFNKEYHPFSSEIRDVYALVVVYQEAYLDREDIYRQVANDLSIQVNTKDYNWLCHHVGYTDQSTIDRFMLTHTDVIPEIVNRDASLNQWLSGRNGGRLSNSLLNYQKKLYNGARDLLYQLFH